VRHSLVQQVISAYDRHERERDRAERERSEGPAEGA
jgi:phosphate starvation-inducible protein PhoH